MIPTIVAQIIVLAYGIGGILLISSPVLGAALFVAVRAAGQVAAFKGISVGGMPIFTLPFLSVCLIGVFSWLRSPHKNQNNGIIFYYYIFVSLAVVSYLANLSSLSPLDMLSKLLAPAFVYTAVYYGIRDEDDVERALRYAVYSSIIPIAFGLIQFASGGGYYIATDGLLPGFRITGTIVDPNHFGIYLSFILCCCVALIQWGRASKLMGIYLLMIIVTIVLAKNRGTWIALVVGVSFSVWMFRRYLKLHYWVGGALIVGMLALPVVLARFQQLSEYDEYGQKQDTFSERLKMHESLLKKSLDSPLVGFGYESSFLPFPGTTFKLLPHNDYVRSAMEFGYIAVLVYIAFFLLQLKFTIDNRKSRYWGVQFGALMLQVYIIIISFSQNLFSDMLNYTLFLYVVAISHRAAELGRPNAKEDARAQLVGKQVGGFAGRRRFNAVPLGRRR